MVESSAVLLDTNLLNIIWIYFYFGSYWDGLKLGCTVKSFTFYSKKIYRKENIATLKSSHKSFGAIVLGSNLKEDESLLYWKSTPPI